MAASNAHTCNGRVHGWLCNGTPVRMCSDLRCGAWGAASYAKMGSATSVLRTLLVPSTSWWSDAILIGYDVT